MMRRGSGVVTIPPKYDDVIYEQSLNGGPGDRLLATSASPLSQDRRTIASNKVAKLSQCCTVIATKYNKKCKLRNLRNGKPLHK